jgi:hypothetical protein
MFSTIKHERPKGPCYCGADDCEKCSPSRNYPSQDDEEQYDFDWEAEGRYREEE